MAMTCKLITNIDGYSIPIKTCNNLDNKIELNMGIAENQSRPTYCLSGCMSLRKHKSTCHT